MRTNIIYNMDCLEGMKQLKDESVDCIITDPPYLIGYQTNRRKNKQHDFCSQLVGTIVGKNITHDMELLPEELKC